MMKRKQGIVFPEGAKNWKLDETLNFINEQKNNPDVVAAEKFRCPSSNDLRQMVGL